MAGGVAGSPGAGADIGPDRTFDGGQLWRLQTLRGGVSELRIDHGPGYRVYYAKVGKTMVLLLCGGDKRRQAADITRAVALLADYRRRSP